MLKNVTGQETDTFDEVNKILNKIIDKLNEVEGKVDKVLALEAKKIEKTTKKKGDK